MKLIDFEDGKLAYRSEGRGDTVVLVHGFGEDHRVWNDFKQDLLEERYRVVSIDLPGFGRSSPLSKPSIDGYAAAVLAVLDHLKLDKVTLIGHSMGGYTALAVAEKQAERLLGLGLFHSHPYADSEEKKQARFKQIDFIHRQGHHLYVKQLVPKLFAERYAKSHPFEVDKLIHWGVRFPVEGITGALQAMAERPDRSSVLADVKCPVLFIVGQEDNAVPADASGKQLALPSVASIHVLPKVGHMGMIESMRPTQLIVRQFADFCAAYSSNK